MSPDTARRGAIRSRAHGGRFSNVRVRCTWSEKPARWAIDATVSFVCTSCTAAHSTRGPGCIRPWTSSERPRKTPRGVRDRRGRARPRGLAPAVFRPESWSIPPSGRGSRVADASCETAMAAACHEHVTFPQSFVNKKLTRTSCEETRAHGLPSRSGPLLYTGHPRIGPAGRRRRVGSCGNRILRPSVGSAAFFESSITRNVARMEVTRRRCTVSE